MKKIILLTSLIFSLNCHGMLVSTKLPKKQYLIKPKQFMDQARFNVREINLRAFAEIITLKKKIQSLEQQNFTLHSEIKDLIALQNNGISLKFTDELLTFRSKDQHRTNGE